MSSGLRVVRDRRSGFHFSNLPRARQFGNSYDLMEAELEIVVSADAIKTATKENLPCAITYLVSL